MGLRTRTTRSPSGSSSHFCIDWSAACCVAGVVQHTYVCTLVLRRCRGMLAYFLSKNRKPALLRAPHGQFASGS
jgi:predicted metal-binding membrane protein